MPKRQQSISFADQENYPLEGKVTVQTIARSNKIDTTAFAPPTSVLDALPVYRVVKNLRDNYVKNVYDHLKVKYRRTVGDRLLDLLFDSVGYLAIIGTSTDLGDKLRATGAFLRTYAQVQDCIGFLCSDPDIGLPLKKAATLYRQIGNIEAQMQGYKNSLRVRASEAEAANGGETRQ